MKNLMGRKEHGEKIGNYCYDKHGIRKKKNQKKINCLFNPYLNHFLVM